MVMASRLSLQSLDKMMELAKVLFPRWLGGCYCLISQSLLSFANRLCLASRIGCQKELKYCFGCSAAYWLHQADCHLE